MMITTPSGDNDHANGLQNNILSNNAELLLVGGYNEWRGSASSLWGMYSSLSTSSRFGTALCQRETYNVDGRLQDPL